MAGAQEKIQRGTAKGVFTRARGTLVEVIQKEADEATITGARDAMVDTFTKLEESNINFLIAAGINVNENPESAEAIYMEGPAKVKAEALFLYGDSCAHRRRAEADEKKVEKEKQLNNEKRAWEAKVTNFGYPAEGLKKLIDKGISA